MKILALETSCDETAVAIIEAQQNNLKILANTVSSQVKLHARWGGVVPNLASREHLKNIIPVLENTFQQASLSFPDIDLIAVTQGPGLIPALLIGTSTAKTLAYYWKKPLLGIHHIEGHIYANFLTHNQIKFPLLALVVSGGHTQLILMKKHLDYQIIGETQDDAVGEAFDKVARLLNLGYPGGPAISQKAEEYEKNKKLQKELASFFITFPRPMLHSPNFNFSFSGLKTAVLYQIKELEKRKINIQSLQPLLAYQFQQAVIDVLLSKSKKAIQKYQPTSFLLAGGVSANSALRETLQKAFSQDFPQLKFYLPQLKFTGDNAAMIASAAFYHWQKNSSPQKKQWKTNWKNLEAQANLKLTS